MKVTTLRSEAVASALSVRHIDCMPSVCEAVTSIGMNNYGPVHDLGVVCHGAGT